MLLVNIYKKKADEKISLIAVRDYKSPCAAVDIDKNQVLYRSVIAFLAKK